MNDLERLERALERGQSRSPTGRRWSSCRTHIGYGSPNKQDTAEAHGAPLGEDEIKLTKEASAGPTEEPFYVPGRGLRALRKAVGARHADEQASGTSALDAYAAEHAELADEFSVDRAPRCRSGRRSTSGCRASSPATIRWRPAARPGKVLELARRAGAGADRRLRRPRAVDADLHQGVAAASRRHDFGGRNLHFGIREHAMGAIVNGMALTAHPALRRHVPRSSATTCAARCASRR